jgi:hypothetical protein
MRMILPGTAALSFALAGIVFACPALAQNPISTQQRIITPSPLPPRAQPLLPPTQTQPRSSQETTSSGSSFEEMLLRNLQKLQENKQGEGGTKKSDKGKQDSSKP